MGSAIWQEIVDSPQRGFRPSGTASSGAVADGLDVVAVGVDNEGGVIVRRVVAWAWRAVVLRPGLERGGMKRPDGGLVRARQGQMDAGPRLVRDADPKNRRIAPEARAAFVGHELLDSERGEGLLIKGGHDVELGGAEADVIDHGAGPLKKCWRARAVRRSWLGRSAPRNDESARSK